MVDSSPQESSSSSQQRIVVIGAGIVGLTLGLALKSLTGLTVEIYEKVPAFHDEVGAGMGLYPNGLRVFKLISPDLLASIRKEGYEFLLRRIERHDGTEIAVGDESALLSATTTSTTDDDDQDIDPTKLSHDFSSVGIRRWRLLIALYNAAMAQEIPIHFDKRLSYVCQSADDGPVEVSFDDGSTVVCDILFAADGSRSKVRELVTTNLLPQEQPPPTLVYTGVTCLMGIAEHGRTLRGICFPAASESQSHGCYFPTGPDEQCFQVNLSIPSENTKAGSWGTLSETVGHAECHALADRLRDEGWDDGYVTPLEGATHAVRIGYCHLHPPMQRWVFGNRIVLLGDAAHPPVPYTGQGAQMGLEDAACIALLVQKLCLDSYGKFRLANFHDAMELYEELRIPRVAEISRVSARWGDVQQQRASCTRRNRLSEERIRRDVFFHQTLSHLLPGVTYDIVEEVEEAVQHLTF